MQAPPPLVSVVAPVYNEEKHIADLLDSLAAQDYSRDRMEIVIVDGGSTDRTRQIVEEHRRRGMHVNLLTNPDRFIARSLNIGIKASRGEIIARIDGHALAPANYVSTCVEYLVNDKADNIGGYLDTVGVGFWGEAIAAATTSAFGVGNSRFRCSREDEAGVPGFPGAFWKKTWEEVGGFDEGFIVNEDDEFIFRLKKHGCRFHKSARIGIRYYCRNSLAALWRQYYGYGFWKAKVIRKHGRPESLRHLIPPSFVAALVVTSAAALAGGSLALLPVALAVTYLGVALWYALKPARGRGLRFCLAVVAAFSTMHVAYGMGFLVGVPRFLSEKPSMDLPGH